MWWYWKRKFLNSKSVARKIDVSHGITGIHSFFFRVVSFSVFIANEMRNPEKTVERGKMYVGIEYWNWTSSTYRRGNPGEKQSGRWEGEVDRGGIGIRDSFFFAFPPTSNRVWIPPSFLYTTSQEFNQTIFNTNRQINRAKLDCYSRICWNIFTAGIFRIFPTH